jgi:hypothetical protein
VFKPFASVVLPLLGELPRLEGTRLNSAEVLTLQVQRNFRLILPAQVDFYGDNN